MSTLMLPSRAYDILKYIALVVLPAVGALYFGLSQIWGFPAGEEVVGTIVLLDTFLGGLLKLSQASYNNSDERFDATLNVDEDTGEPTWIDVEPEVLASRNEVLVRINPIRAPQEE